MSSIPDPRSLVDRVHLIHRYETAEQRRARILSHYGPDVVRANGLTPKGSYVQDALLPGLDVAGSGRRGEVGSADTVSISLLVSGMSVLWAVAVAVGGPWLDRLSGLVALP